VILVHYKNGITSKLDPTDELSLRALDSPKVQSQIRRVAILDGYGHRVDLPSFKNGINRIWIEIVRNGDEIRGERICVMRNREILKVTMYYSDGRVVLDM